MTGRDRWRQTEADGYGQIQTETDRQMERVRGKETGGHIWRQMETDRDRQRQIDTDRDNKYNKINNKNSSTQTQTVPTTIN